MMTTDEIRKRYPDNGFQKIIIGATPEGGAFSVLSWSRKDGTPCKESEAEQSSLVIYDADGNRINLLISTIL